MTAPLLARDTAASAVVQRTTVAEPCYLPDGRLTFTAPAGAYAALAAWHSRLAWLGAAKLHPHLTAACRGRIAVPRFLAVLAVLAAYADGATGRNVAVAYATVADRLGVCEKTIQRACRAAEDLGLLVRVLEGSDMTLEQRMAVLGHYSKGSRSAKWRALPNIYAAVMPAPVAALTPLSRAPKTVRGSSYGWAMDAPSGRPVDTAVDLRVHESGNVRLPVGSRFANKTSVTSYSSRNTFDPSCGQPNTSPPPTPPHPNRTAAPRPTTTHRQEQPARPVRRLDPAVEEWARALRAQLPGYHHVSLHRICPALSCFVTAGLSPSTVLTGLNTYLAALGRSWLTVWTSDQHIAQAKYLIGMLTHARQAGYLPLTGSDPPRVGYGQ